jgi:hypothetical protein
LGDEAQGFGQIGLLPSDPIRQGGVVWHVLLTAKHYGTGKLYLDSGPECASPRPEVLEAQAETPGRLYTGRIRAIAWPVGSQWVASGKPAVGLIHFLLSLPLAYHWLTPPMPTRCPHHPGRLCRTPTPPSHNDSPGAALAFATGQNMPCPALLGTGTVKRGQCGTAR